jgi:hypothetical protein
VRTFGPTYCHKCGFKGASKSDRSVGFIRVDSGCAHCGNPFTHCVPRGVVAIYDEEP